MGTEAPNYKAKVTYMKIIPFILLLALPCFGQTTNCVPAPSGLVGLWRGEAAASDSVGTNNGTLLNGAGFAPGVVGQAFAITSLNQAVQVPDAPALHPTNGLTLEAWVFVSSLPTDEAVVAGKNQVNVLVPYEINLKPLGTRCSFRAIVWPQSGGASFDGTVSVQTNTWYHVALTYDNATLRLYVNGAPDGSLTVPGPIVTSSGPFWIGGVGVPPWTLLGRVDEVSLYNRPLAASEIQAIYAAGSAGKCAAPLILVQPQGQIGYWGRSVTFFVSATGISPLGYLWYKDGFPIPWATNSSLVLTNLSLNDGGQYSVLVTNALGALPSSNAFLDVNPAGVSLGIYPGLTLEGAVGNRYGIQYTTNVSPTATWITLDQVTLSQPVQLWTDATANLAAGANPRRFYRVVAIP